MTKKITNSWPKSSRLFLTLPIRLWECNFQRAWDNPTFLLRIALLSFTNAVRSRPLQSWQNKLPARWFVKDESSNLLFLSNSYLVFTGSWCHISHFNLVSASEHWWFAWEVQFPLHLYFVKNVPHQTNSDCENLITWNQRVFKLKSLKN